MDPQAIVHNLTYGSYQWRVQDFPEVGTPTLQGAPTYDFAKFSQKLHEIERIYTRGGASLATGYDEVFYSF